MAKAATETFKTVVVDLSKKQIKQITDALGELPVGLENGTIAAQVFFDGALSA